MKKLLFVISPQQFRDTELLDTEQALQKVGIETAIASTEVGESTGANGAIVHISLLVSKVNPDDFDGVAFIGGPGMVPMVDNIELKRLAADFHQKGKLTAAICAAVGILANANLIKGLRVTSWAGVKNLITEKGGNWLERSVIIDGHLVTADGPSSAHEFGQTIAKRL